MELPGTENNGVANGAQIKEQNDVTASIMAEEDFHVVLKWAGFEGWNPRKGDAKLFFLTDGEGFFMSKTGKGGPVSCVSAVKYGEDYGFMGVYICFPEHRGRGHGLSIFQREMEHLEGRVMGLDAVKVQQPNYAKQSFVFAHDHTRFASVAVANTEGPAL